MSILDLSNIIIITILLIAFLCIIIYICILCIVIRFINSSVNVYIDSESACEIVYHKLSNNNLNIIFWCAIISICMCMCSILLFDSIFILVISCCIIILSLIGPVLYILFLMTFKNNIL